MDPTSQRKVAGPAEAVEVAGREELPVEEEQEPEEQWGDKQVEEV